MIRLLGAIVICLIVLVGLRAPDRSDRELAAPFVVAPAPEVRPIEPAESMPPHANAVEADESAHDSPSPAPEPQIEPASEAVAPALDGFTIDRLVESAVWGRYVLEPWGSVDLPLAEIVAFDAPRAQLLATCDAGLAVIDISAPGAPRVVTVIDVAASCGFAEPGAGISHVSIDPPARGVAAVTILPAKKALVPGTLAFVSLTRLEVIAHRAVGYGPDAVEFAPDGSCLVIANEGEWADREGGVIDDPPPSVTIVSLSGVRNEWHFESLTDEDARTVHFGGAPLRDALALPGAIRINPTNQANAGIDLEPESVAIIGDRAYVTLQENNAVAEFDTERGELLRVAGLGTARIPMDISDRDGASIGPATDALPMPDQIKAFTINGTGYLITANEGDTRGELGVDAAMPDHARLSALARDGRLAGALSRDISQSPDELGRLAVCAFTGDTNGDGLIEEPTALGARSASIFDAETLKPVGNTGAQFATIILQNWPSLFNANGEGELSLADNRSDNRGCEPEGIAIGAVGGVPLAFVGLERPGAVACVDLRNPAAPQVVGMTMLAKLGHVGPEGLAFIPPESSPLGGEPMLAVACEMSGTVTLWRVVDRYNE